MFIKRTNKRVAVMGGTFLVSFLSEISYALERFEYISCSSVRSCLHDSDGGGTNYGCMLKSQKNEWRKSDYIRSNIEFSVGPS